MTEPKPNSSTHTHQSAHQTHGGQPEEQRLQKILRTLGQAVARLVMVTNKPALEFLPAYKAGVLDTLIAENPRMPISALSLRSGIDRRQVSQYVKQRRITEREKRNKLMLILGELKRFSDSAQMIPKKGTLNSFEAICKRYASGDFSPGAILRELERLQTVRDRGDFIELINPYLSARENTTEFFEIVTWSVDQLIQTALHNRQTSHRPDRNFQRTVYSTQIPLEKRAQVHAELKAILESSYRQALDVLEKNEVPVAAGTYEPLGIGLFQIGRPHLADESTRWGDEE